MVSVLTEHLSISTNQFFTRKYQRAYSIRYFSAFLVLYDDSCFHPVISLVCFCPLKISILTNYQSTSAIAWVIGGMIEPTHAPITMMALIFS